MPSKTILQNRKVSPLTKGISIDEPLYRAALARAKEQDISFSHLVRRAIQRDLNDPKVTRLTPQALDQRDELMDISEVCRRLNLSVWTVRRRSRDPHDPLRRAKSKIGKQKPMQFVRSRIEQLERAA